MLFRFLSRAVRGGLELVALRLGTVDDKVLVRTAYQIAARLSNDCGPKVSRASQLVATLNRRVVRRYADDPALAVVAAPVELEPFEYCMVWGDAVVVSAVDILRGYNRPGGVAHEKAQRVADHAVREVRGGGSRGANRSLHQQCPSCS